jgi:predicted CoA-binding protein
VTGVLESNLVGRHSWFWEGEKRYAVVGVSGRRKRFGNSIFEELKRGGHKCYAVGRVSGEIYGAQIHESLSALPERPDRVVICTKPPSAKGVVEDCARLGIGEIWFQQGSFAPELGMICGQEELKYVRGSCALLYLVPTKFPHNVHAWLAKLLGAY